VARSAKHDADAAALSPDDVARIGFLFSDDKQFELVRNVVLRTDIKWFLI
jgi:hypothetical protein